MVTLEETSVVDIDVAVSALSVDAIVRSSWNNAIRLLCYKTWVLATEVVLVSSSAVFGDCLEIHDC